MAQPHQPAGPLSLRQAAAAAVLWLLLASAAHAQTVILYARADQLHAHRAAGLASVWDTVWLDADLQAGTAWRAEVARRILTARRVLVLWSARAAVSPEVAAEWRIALASQAQVLPVMLDDTPMPPELAARQAIDWR